MAGSLTITAALSSGLTDAVVISLALAGRQLWLIGSRRVRGHRDRPCRGRRTHVLLKTHIRRTPRESYSPGTALDAWVSIDADGSTRIELGHNIRSLHLVMTEEHLPDLAKSNQQTIDQMRLP
jgi:hypothetical protein